MTDTGFAFLLSVGTGLLAGILLVARVSARKLEKRVRERRIVAATAQAEIEPEFEFHRENESIGARFGLVRHMEVRERT